MRTLTFGTVLSGLLWASIAWCTLAARVSTGHNHYRLSAQDFGVYLLCLDFAFAATLAWYNRMELRAD